MQWQTQDGTFGANDLPQLSWGIYDAPPPVLWCSRAIKNNLRM